MDALDRYLDANRDRLVDELRHATDGRVLVDGFYDDVRRPTPAELARGHASVSRVHGRSAALYGRYATQE